MARLAVQPFGLLGEELGRRPCGVVHAEDIEIPHEGEAVVEESAAEAKGDNPLGAPLSERLLEGDRALELGHGASPIIGRCDRSL